MDRRNPFQHQHHHHLQHHLIQQQQQLPPPPPPLSMTSPMDPGGGIDQRIPQWSIEETNELLAIREELDQTFMETKRNKVLWEHVATRMAEKGFVRSPEQCKSKWKNLVTRYKACEVTEGDGIRQQFPFYNEIQSILAARVQRMLWAEAIEPSTSSKRKHNQLSSDEEEEEEEQEVDEPNQDINKELMSLADTQKKETEVITTSTCTTPRKRAKRGKGVAGTSSKSETTGSSSSTLKEVLEEFMRQTVKMEKEWREAWETKERERERRENEWRRRMAELEEERAAAERRWMEREEERRLREEARAQRREILIDALLNKLNRDHSDAHNQGF